MEKNGEAILILTAHQAGYIHGVFTAICESNPDDTIAKKIHAKMEKIGNEFYLNTIKGTA